MTEIGNELEYLLGMLGTVAFAVTAVLTVIPKGIDLFGACVMGVITAVGGGTIRDLILDVPVFWAGDQTYIWVALIASVVAFRANLFMGRRKIHQLMLYLDALGVSLFSIQAMQKVIDLDFGLPLAPIVLGVVTAIGGGMIRDMLADSPTLLLSSEVYAIPITLGCILYSILSSVLPDQTVVHGFLCMALIFAFCSAAIYWNLTVARWMTTRLDGL
jgi:uncharacterized membrane protein YeiH